MMSELFINYMREKGIEPTENDVKHFNFMAKVQMEDELDSLKEQLDKECLEKNKLQDAVIDLTDQLEQLEKQLKPSVGTINEPILGVSIESSVQYEGKSIVRSTPKRATSPLYRVQVSQSWEGVVYEVDRDAHEFTSVISDKTNPENPREQVVLSIDEVSSDDESLLQEGAVFYWSIGHQYKGATKSKLSTISFSRLKPFTSKSIQKAKKKANILNSAKQPR